MEPFTFSLPIMKAMLGSCVPARKPLKVSMLQASVTSDSASWFETAAGSWVESTKTIPSSPKSNLTRALIWRLFQVYP
jgi:hypothetical protein